MYTIRLEVRASALLLLCATLCTTIQSFCHSTVEINRYECVKVVAQIRNVQIHSKNEAYRHCQDKYAAILPRPRNAKELRALAYAMVTNTSVYLDASKIQGDDSVTSLFRYGDGTLVNISIKSQGATLDVINPLSTECLIFNKFHGTYVGSCSRTFLGVVCEWCPPLWKYKNWVNNMDCRPHCMCPEGVTGCGAECTSRKECARVKVPIQEPSCDLKPCPYNRYGTNCQYQCHCANRVPCHQKSGNCPGRQCMPHWSGDTCNQTRCPANMGGFQCDIECHCVGDMYCNISGVCLFGCHDGYHGLRCNSTGYGGVHFGTYEVVVKILTLALVVAMMCTILTAILYQSIACPRIRGPHSHSRDIPTELSSTSVSSGRRRVVHFNKILEIHTYRPDTSQESFVKTEYRPERAGGSEEEEASSVDSTLTPEPKKPDSDSDTASTSTTSTLQKKYQNISRFLRAKNIDKTFPKGREFKQTPTPQSKVQPHPQTNPS